MNDSSELPYFEQVHHGSWWRVRGDHPFVYRSRIRFLRRVVSTGRLLDVGSGEGFFARRAARCWSVVAVEPRLDGAERTRSRVPSVLRGDATHLAIRSACIELVTLWDVVEHVSDPGRLIDEVTRCLTPGGVVAISTPNPEALSVRRRGTDSVQYSDPTHVSVLSRDSWRNLLEARGLSVTTLGTDAWWDPPYFRWTPDVLWKLLAQVMLATRLCWPFRSGENIIIVARLTRSIDGR